MRWWQAPPRAWCVRCPRGGEYALRRVGSMRPGGIAAVATWRCRREETALALALDMHAVYGRVATPAFHPGQIRALLAALEARGASVSAWVYHLLDKRAAGARWIASA